jgi:outer membrane protein assembly factor BamB
MKPSKTRRSVLKSLTVLTLTSVLDACGGGRTTASEEGRGLASSAWPKYRGNAGNTGQASGYGATGVLRWCTALGTTDRVEGSAVIGPDGTVYIGADDGKVYALNGVTGATRWSTMVQTAGADSTPVLGADGRLYMGAGHSVLAIDASTGAQLWKFDTAGDVESAPTLASNGTLYFGCDDAKVYALDSNNGTLLWYFTFPDGSDTDSSPALGLDGTVYIGSDKGTLYALHGQQGYLKWTFQAIGEISGAPAIGSDGSITICALNAAKTTSFTYAIDAQTGLLNWAASRASQSAPSAAIDSDGTVFVSGVSTPSILNGVLVAKGALVCALNGETGVQKWEQWLEPGSVGVTAVSVDGAGILYVQTERPAGPGAAGKLFALESMTGGILWEFVTNGSGNSSPTIAADGTVYVGSDDGKVYAIG